MKVFASSWVLGLALYLIAQVSAHGKDYESLKMPHEYASDSVQEFYRSRPVYLDAVDASLVEEAQEKVQAAPSLKRKLEVHLQVKAERFSSSFLSFNSRSYNGEFPAPTLRVAPGDTLILNVHNGLGDGDVNLTNVHTHGLHVSPKGMADNVLVDIPSGETRRYEYHIHEDHPSGTFWYHPHHHGAVNTQLTGMMAGALVVEDRRENFPVELERMKDVVLLLQALCIKNCDNKWDNLEDALDNEYPRTADKLTGLEADVVYDEKALPLKNPALAHIFVNGQYRPKIHLHPLEYQRFRYVNALSNNLVELTFGEAPCEMHMIARDGVYRDEIKMNVRVVIIPPGGRVDVAIRCLKNGVFYLKNDRSQDRVATLGAIDEHRVPTQIVLDLHVEGNEQRMELPSVLPRRSAYMTDLRTTRAPPESHQYAYQFTTWKNEDGVHFGVNHKVFEPKFINHTMKLLETQEWELSEQSTGICSGSASPCHKMNHPFHVHSTHFQIVAHEDNGYDMSDIYEIGEWRDTVPLHHDRIRIRFQPRRLGKVLTHCHIGSHADIGMAQLFDVVP